MFGKEPFEGLVEGITGVCKHENIEPYGDGEYGRCTRCGDESFPMYDPNRIEALVEELKALPVIARKKVLDEFCSYCGDAGRDCVCMNDD